MPKTVPLLIEDPTTIGKQPLKAKLKSWTRWFAVVGPILPYIADAVRADLPGWVVAGSSLLILLVGFGLIKLEDLARIRAGLVLVQASLAASSGLDKIRARQFIDAPASGMEPANPQ